MKIKCTILLTLGLTMLSATATAQTIFVRGLDGAPWMNESSSWSPLDGTLGGAPDACASGNEIVLAARGGDNGAWIRRRTGTTWAAWQPLGGIATSDVSVICTSGGGARVFARGSDQALWTRSTTDDWTSLGGQLDGAPEAAVSATGAIDVVARGLDQAVWHIGWNGRAWSDWRSLGGRTASDPTIASLSANRMEIVITHSDGSAHYGTLPASGPVAAWHPLGGVQRGSLDAASAGDGTMIVVARGSDDAVWKISFDGTRWNGWSSVGGQIESDPTVAVRTSGGATARTTPPAAPSARYEVRVVGFQVNRQSTDDLLNRDGWGDEVYLAPVYLRIGAAGEVLQYAGGTYSGLYGQADQPGVTQAGTGRDNGGLVTGNAFPENPRVGPIPGSTAILFTGELTSGQGGAVLIPTLWEWDNREEMRSSYFENVSRARAEIAGRAAAAFASLRSGDLSRFVRDGSELGLAEVVRWPGAPGPHDYPFGSARPPDGGMAFTPKVIVLTYEVAEHILANATRIPALARNNDDFRVAEVGGEPGLFAIRYTDQADGFSADYTLYIRLTRR